ncbi:MAG: hypothetical protein JXR73_01300 [Candidatus Omnitrophica bacterium]|nr:hypothetical protein [Candidatus Omnitrophota bacterium]
MSYQVAFVKFLDFITNSEDSQLMASICGLDSSIDCEENKLCKEILMIENAESEHFENAVAKMCEAGWEPFNIVIEPPHASLSEKVATRIMYFKREKAD